MISHLTEKHSKLCSFNKQQHRPQNCPLQSSFAHRTAQFTQGILQFPQLSCRHHDDIISRQHPFLAIHSADEHRMIYSFPNTTSYSIFYYFFSDSIMADVASKQQTTALFLSTSHTHMKTHSTDQKTDKPDGQPVLCYRTFSSFFRAVFYTLKIHSLTSSVWGPLVGKVSSITDTRRNV